MNTESTLNSSVANTENGHSPTSSSVLKKIGIGVGIIVLVVIALFAQAQRYVSAESSIIIAADPQTVWNFLSDNRNAHGWSVFFDHISPLPGQFAEGTVGSIRRCYRNADEHGISWDEKTVHTEPYKFRLIYGYNIQGIKSDIIKNYRFNAYQYYEDLGGGKTKLTLKGDLSNWKEYGFVDRFVYWLSSFDVERAFKYNLTNIRDMIEQKENYNRQYGWEKETAFDNL